MKLGNCEFSCEDVLNAFSVERVHDRSTLERYLRDFPQYAVEIAHLSHDLSRPTTKRELSEEDSAVIEDAWNQYSSSLATSVKNLFAELSLQESRNLATTLGIPRQVITALREQRVIPSSIPTAFLSRIADVLKVSLEEIKAAINATRGTQLMRSYKSDEKPADLEPVTFEQLLIEAQVSDERRAELMKEGE